MSKKELFILISIFSAIFIFLIYLAENGEGYPKYDGEKAHNGFFYSGHFHSSPNMRIGSVDGPRHQGGGLHGGK